jgi:hypothetical protein
VTPVRVGVGARWRRDNRPDFPGIAVWVDAVGAVAEVEIEAGAFGFGRGEGRAGAGYGGQEWPAHRGVVGDTVAGGDGAWASGGRESHRGEGAGGEPSVRCDGECEAAEPEDCDPVPWAVDAWSADYGRVWRPLAGSGREPRPGLLLSVVRAGVVVAYPTPLPDPPTGALARALARVERPERRPEVLAVDVEPPPPPPRRMPSQKAYTEVRALVGILVEVLVGRRTATHAARWTDPDVRGKLRTPRYARTTTLKSVRLSESGAGVEALALLRDGARTRAVALRFDRDEDSRWRCTALQAG